MRAESSVSNLTDLTPEEVQNVKALLLEVLLNGGETHSGTLTSIQMLKRKHRCSFVYFAKMGFIEDVPGTPYSRITPKGIAFVEEP